MNSRFLVDTFMILDDRNREETEELVKESDLIILGGGHVPTQNKFFREIHLKKYLKEAPLLQMGGDYSLIYYV